MNGILTLIKRAPGSNEITKRDVFCGTRSIGRTEFYQANANGFHPEGIFVLADHLDYDDETLADYNGTRYRILRTYRTGQELELTVVRASAEEARL